MRCISIRRILFRVLRRTSDVFCAVLLFGVTGFILTALLSFDVRSSQKWKYDFDRDPEGGQSRLRVRDEQVLQFKRERDIIHQELVRLKQLRTDDTDDDGFHPPAVRDPLKLPKVDHSVTATGKTTDSTRVNVRKVKQRRLHRGMNTGDKRLAKQERQCNVYNLSSPVEHVTEGEFDCVQLRIKPKTTICLFSDEDDVHVSRHIREDGLWEPHEIRLFQNLLYQNADLSVIDIGAQLGEYSLLAATMGRQVVAVEPMPASIRRFHQAVKLGRLEKQVGYLASDWSGLQS